MKCLLLALVGFSLAASASAQTGVTITALTVQVFRAGDAITGIPFGTPQTVTWPLAAAVGACNLTPTTPSAGTVVNPGNLEFDDPALAGKACRVNFAAYFASFAAATGYKATTTYTYSDGVVSARSNATGPFDEVAAHPAPTGVGVRP
jgi:hypothetical protein